MSFWKDKKVFLTGHTGFKGSWLSIWLNTLGAEVCGYSLEPESEPNMYSGTGVQSLVRSEIADIRDAGKLKSVMADFKPDLVFHLAAQSLVRRSYSEPLDTYATNLMGTVNLLDAVRTIDSVRAAVVVTTDKVYENRESMKPYREDEPFGGFDPYSSSKACAEIATSAYRRSFFDDRDCLVATARAGNVIGGGDWSDDRLFPDVVRAVQNGNELLIRNPQSVRPWQHVLEPLLGYLMLAERLAKGEHEFAGGWNFGPSSDDSRSVSEVLDLIGSSWGEPVLWNSSAGRQPHESNLLTLDSSKANEKLGWIPKLDLEEAVDLTVSWYQTFMEKSDIHAFTKSQIESYLQR